MYQAASWIITCVATSMVATRIAIRLRISRRLFADDYLNIIALLFLVANAILTTIMADPLYELMYASLGVTPGPDFMIRATFYLKCQLASTFLFWSTLWSVKACFLALYRQITVQLRWPGRAWWIVTIITASSFIGCIIAYFIATPSFDLGKLGSFILSALANH